jgi:methylated-DNA-[protein]-cysteine S-methyltransferase
MPILSDRIPTPIGDMMLLAADNVLLLLEFVDAEGRVEREISARFSKAEITPTKNPFGFSQHIANYFAGDLHTIDSIPTDGGGTKFQRRV